MSAVASITRYQARELAIRWRAQPASPLARWFLTFALAAAAGVLLLGFAAAETSRRVELRRLGLDTIVVQAPATSLLPENAVLPPDHWAAPLETQGDLLLLQQLPEPAYTPWSDPMPVFVAPLRGQHAEIDVGLADINFRVLTPSATWVTRTLPPGRRVRLTRRNLPFTAVTATPTENFSALGLDDFVLVAPPAADEADAKGRLDVILFRPWGHGLTPAPAVRSQDMTPSAVRRLFAAEGQPPPAIRDPAPYRAALDLFTRSQSRWRTGMALLLCLCVLLAFASIGMLEERQTRYTQALLRSFGVPGGALWAVSLVENLLLANTALLAALLASRLAARIVLELAGASPGLPVAFGDHALLWLACAVNFGVVLSLMPLARALRRPVGVVLP